MNTRFPELSDWFLKSVVIEDDGVLGVPVTLTSYTATDAAVMTPVIEYIVGTRRERIGLEDDVSILSDLVKDYIVVVVDFAGAEPGSFPFVATIEIDGFETVGAVETYYVNASVTEGTAGAEA